MIYQVTYSGAETAAQVARILTEKKSAGEDVILDVLPLGNILFLATSLASAPLVASYLKPLQKSPHEYCLVVELNQNFDFHVPPSFTDDFRTLRSSPVAQMMSTEASIPFISLNGANGPNLEDIVGLDYFKDQVPGIIRGIATRRHIRKNGGRIDPRYDNLLITGPSGMGKTILAQALARAIHASKVIPFDAPARMMHAGNLINMNMANVDADLRQTLCMAPHGVLVIDGLEALFEHNNRSILLSKLYSQIQAFSSEIVFIATCADAPEPPATPQRGSSPNSLTAIIISSEDQRPKLGQYFPHIIPLSKPYAEEELITIFFKKAKAAGMECDSTVGAQIKRQLEEIKKNAPAGFANAWAIDKMFLASVNGLDFSARAVQEPPDQKITILAGDIPDYDKDLQSFIPKAQAPNSLQAGSRTVVAMKGNTAG